MDYGLAGGFFTGLGFGGGALFSALFGVLFGLFEAERVSFDLNDLCMMDKAVDQRNDTGGIGKDLVPLGEGAV